MTIWFDMDGTIANFYGVKGWLDYLINEDVTPYAIAQPLINMSRLARLLHKAQSNGYAIGILSWTSKNGHNEFNLAVTETKLKWLNNHLPSVQWDEIKIINYGTPKENFKENNDILFDDEMPNRDGWGIGSYEPNKIFEILKAI